jgi:hypothetical protein
MRAIVGKHAVGTGTLCSNNFLPYSRTKWWPDVCLLAAHLACVREVPASNLDRVSCSDRTGQGSAECGTRQHEGSLRSTDIKINNNLALFQSFFLMYEVVSKSFRTDRLERELLMVQLSAIRCSCIAIL